MKVSKRDKLEKLPRKLWLKNLIIQSTTKKICNGYEYSLVQNDCVWLD